MIGSLRRVRPSGTIPNLQKKVIEWKRGRMKPESEERVKISNDDPEEHVRHWRDRSDRKRIVDEGEKCEPDERKLRSVKSGQVQTSDY